MKRDAGVTLVELLVALVVFALIAVAGFALVDGTLRVQERTDGRLERLAEVQRALHLVTADFEQAADGPLVLVDGTLSFRRAGASAETADIPVSYTLDDDALIRTVGAGVAARPQRLLTGVSAARFQVFTTQAGWTETPPLGPDGLPIRPSAVSAEFELASAESGLSGSLRRIIVLPAAP